VTHRFVAIVAFLASVAWSQTPAPPLPKSNTQHQPPAANIQNATSNDQRGTDSSPIVVKVLPSAQADQEAPQGKNKSTNQPTDWWMFGATMIIAIIGAIQTRVFWVQAERLKQTIEKMDEISAKQTEDIQKSLAESTRGAGAMESIAKSMASNIESVRQSVAINREMAERQKLVTELQSRAYLYAAFNTATFQDAHHVFEVQVVLSNRGNTPAYDVTFRAVAQIVSVPFPDDFTFPLPSDTAGTSVSLIAPGTTKLMARQVSSRVPDDQVDAIKVGGPPRCLAMWGIVKYRDAFKEPRQLRFAFTVAWIPWVEGRDKDKDGNPLPPQIMSYDTAHHNDSD
jgi:hypothetical protein